jgi:hypothetical protein
VEAQLVELVSDSDLSSSAGGSTAAAVGVPPKPAFAPFFQRGRSKTAAKNDV